MSISVVIPSYDSASWLPSTLRALSDSISRSQWSAEVIVVNDGSSDNTVSTLTELQAGYPYRLRILNQENKGRFLARWAGVNAAENEWIFILDSRVLMNEDSLDYLLKTMSLQNDNQSWNGHVLTDPMSPLVGRFWEVPTFVFWGDYLAHPRPTLITSENFDKVPKGTGCLVVRKQLYLEACRAVWPSGNAHLVSDDTKLLRFIVDRAPIRIDPGFSATYRPRTTLKGFLAHSWTRGTLFVDSYAGTSVARNIVLVSLVFAPPVLVGLGLVLSLLGRWQALALEGVAGAAGLLIPLVIASIRGCPVRAGLSYVTFIFPFGVSFWAGLTRGVIVHRRSFQNRKQSMSGAQL
ncbi:glycosyltransferase [Cryobacterium sp. TMT2-10]|nr:glycosyltransferase [Cryobacterium sp. TMT2-10]